MLLLWCFTASLGVCSSDIITLISNESITCVLTDDDLDSAVYLDPPIPTRLNRQESTEFDWIYDDWNQTQSLHSLFGPVTDQRWTEFPIKGRSEKVLLSETPLSFSVCTEDSFILRVEEENHADSSLHVIKTAKQINDSSPCQWNHYTVMRNNTSIQLFSNGTRIFQSEFNYIPGFIYIEKLIPRTAWKFHAYEFRASTTPSKDEQQSSSLAIENLEADKICVSVFVALDRDSTLKIVLESDGDEIVVNTVNGFNKPGLLRSWQEVQVEVGIGGLAKLSFIRILENNATNGYWAISDIHSCSQDQDVFRAKLDDLQQNVNYHCKRMSKSLSESNITSQTKNCEDKGFIGSYCDVNCSSVLGEEFKNCEGHKICYGDDECFCAWDNQGEPCVKKNDVRKHVKKHVKEHHVQPRVTLPFYVDDFQHDTIENAPEKNNEKRSEHSHFRVWTTILYCVFFLVIIMLLCCGIKYEIIPPYKQFKENLQKKQQKTGQTDVEMLKLEKNELLPV